MKKWEKDYFGALTKAGKKRHLRTRKKKRNQKVILRKARSIVRVVSPIMLNLYNLKGCKELMCFLRDIEKGADVAYRRGAKLFICFRNLTKIAAGAALVLLARVEELRTKYPRLKIKCSRPPKSTDQRDSLKKPKPNLADSILEHIGFYRLLGYNSHITVANKTVSCWESLKGTEVEPSNVGLMLEKVEAKANQTFNHLYRPAVEAMSNAVEHAYPNCSKKRWWMFTTIFPGSDELVLIIYDVGVGIPNTLEKTQSFAVIREIKRRWGIQLDSDLSYIKAALRVKETRTKLGHRGKGTSDLKSVVDNVKGASLLIQSNKGQLKYINPELKKGRANSEIGVTLPMSVRGTLIELSIPLKREAKTA